MVTRCWYKVVGHRPTVLSNLAQLSTFLTSSEPEDKSYSNKDSYRDEHQEAFKVFPQSLRQL